MEPMIKYIIAYLPARLMFYAGDLLSMLLQRFPGESDETSYRSDILPTDMLWSTYQWLMNKSSVIDEWGATGLWRDV